MTKTESRKETIFTVIAPPNVGFYKLEIFATKMPRNHGPLQLPLVAIFLVEVRLQFSSDSLAEADNTESKENNYSRKITHISDLVVNGKVIPENDGD